ncbi:hypothetical protein JO972_01925 [Verrucomicrobiaceae bacterium 5K15]|uniref:Uncharacterized protein n=1 Tax=Oceaniferula flava TaxID=2800421 RepID=A0AAE2SB72_9BACT|nr:hypothetical protein [Oceaniferula flavus]MBK1853704.1 hypothetical protein [Oceaniferula flavus]MBM1135010.1 hypothetical protein [Oceaniferula flavus]
MTIETIEAPLLSESEVRRKVFSKEARPSKESFARIRREMGVPHVKIGRKVFYQELPVREFFLNYRET